jgi:hypothetical protein
MTTAVQSHKSSTNNYLTNNTNEIQKSVANKKTVETCKHIKYYNLDGVCKLEVFRDWYINPEDRKAEEREFGRKDIDTGMYECNVCDNFGLSGKRCTRCGDFGGSYYCGRGMSEEDCYEAIERMESYDKEGIRAFDYSKMYRKEIVIDLVGDEEY